MASNTFRAIVGPALLTRVLQKIQRNREFTLTLVSLNIGAICMGMTVGSTDTSLLYYMVPRSVYNEEFEDDTSTRSLMIIGVSLGALLPVFFVDVYGRRTSFGLSAAVNGLSWICLTLTHNKMNHVTAGFVAGLAGGMFQTTVVLYIGEISSPSNRANVGASVAFCTYCGVTFAEFIIIFVDFKVFAAAMTLAPMAFALTIVHWMIESPYFLYQRGKILEAKLSLKSLRGKETVLDVDGEFAAMSKFSDEASESWPGVKPLLVFRPKHASKSLLVTLILLYASQFAGGYAMADYAAEVMDAAIPHYGNIFFSTLDVVSVGICLFVVERVGQKRLLVFSIFGSSCCCLVLAIYRLALRDGCAKNDAERLLPAAMIVIYCAIYSLGLIPILPVLAGEIFPHRVKTQAVGFSMMIVYLIGLLMQEAYYLLSVQVGACVTFAAFTFLGSLGLPLAMTTLPETMGKSLYEIQDELGDITLIMC